MMRLLITGASGYLGSKLCAKLKGHKIICPCISGTEDALAGLKNVTVVDVADDRFFNKIKDFGADTVINIAGVYDNQPFKAILDGNLVFPLSILDRLATSLSKWININTSLPRTLSPYSLSKHQLSDWGAYYSSKFGLCFSDIQLEQFYGTNDGRFLSFVIKKLLSNEILELTVCLQKRDLIHVDDVCDGIICLLGSDLVGYQSVPLGCGVAPSLKEAVEFCKQATLSNSEIRYGAKPLREGEPMLSVADTSVMTRYGFTPKWDWKSGLIKIIEEMQQ